VTRRNGGDVVILAREDYEAMDETAYLLRSPANAKRLYEALRRPAEERVVMDIDELRRLVET
jgi:antitoxin YefM